MLNRYWVIFVAALGNFSRIDGFPLAGNIAFSVILSAFPFLIFLTTLAGFLGNDALAEDAIFYLLEVAPQELVDPIVPEIRSLLTVPRSDLLSLSVLLTLWTASGSVRSVRAGMNRAYSIPDNRNFFFLLLTDIFFVLIWSASLIALSLLIVIGPIIWDKATYWAPAVHDFTIWFSWLRFPVVFVLLALSLIGAHQFLPARRHTFKEIVPGAAITLTLWFIIALAYAQYLALFASYASTYAGLAGIIIAMVFIYLSGAILIFGGTINQAIIAHQKPVQHD